MKYDQIDAALVVLSRLHKPQHSPEDKVALERLLDRMDAIELRLLLGADKLASGKQYSLTTMNPEDVSLWSELAEHLGASLQSEKHERLIHVLLTPVATDLTQSGAGHSSAHCVSAAF
jgi:hypothetical protein